MIIPSDDEFLDVGAVVVRDDESIYPACVSGAPCRRQVRSMDERISIEWGVDFAERLDAARSRVRD